MSDLEVRQTGIPGLLIVRLPVHHDTRGWFKENWQREKVIAAGLPDFAPVQQNVAFNGAAGVTRGIHAEPWDKYVSVATGRVFGAWADMRAGPGFGRVVTLEFGPDTAVFVPRGVGNAYQTLDPGTAYTYLVNDHWSAAAKARYVLVNLGDTQLDIPWPIPLTRAVVSPEDAKHPPLADVAAVRPGHIVVLGSNGQLGRALMAAVPGAVPVGRDTVDLSDPGSLDRIDWSGVDTVINAAAYTGVDAAETPTGRRAAWAANVAGVAALVERVRERRCRLVHISSDYVFDGELLNHREDEPFSPLGVYGQTKAAGDALVATYPQHLLVRTSWVVGQGKNFVATMVGLADRGATPAVVHDQFGRLTFAEDLAEGIVHLLTSGSPFGTYNLSNTGPVTTWAEIAQEIFRARGRPASDVTPVTTDQYAAGKTLAPRPHHSDFDLGKISSIGFEPADALTRLRSHIAQL